MTLLNLALELLGVSTKKLLILKGHWENGRLDTVKLTIEQVRGSHSLCPWVWRADQFARKLIRDNSKKSFRSAISSILHFDHVARQKKRQKKSQKRLQETALRAESRPSKTAADCYDLNSQMLNTIGARRVRFWESNSSRSFRRQMKKWGRQ